MLYTLNSMEEAGANGAFKQFDVVSDYLDHYYAGKPPSNASSKRIMQEWKILQEGLPESIFVRVYDDRIDLLRAMIIGASGTPYHDGLFFFDLHFPPNYPNDPPQVHYRSYGLSINPNLYKNGHVCLSLLNTWYGRSSQRWNPSQSTILQVLVSIQGLVLNERPYYNEPLVGRIGSVTSWESYNEWVFELSCKTMLHVLNEPPNHFKPLVASHFRQRARTILRACEAYRNGWTMVGFYGCLTSSSRRVPTSFRNSITKFYVELSRAFIKDGAWLGDDIMATFRSMEEEEKATHDEKKRRFLVSVFLFMCVVFLLVICNYYLLNTLL